MSHCTRCQDELNESNSSLSQRTRRKNGNCFVCQRRDAKWKREARPKSFIIYRMRGNAKTRGIEFSLTEATLPSIPEYCPVFPWIKLVYEVGKGRSDGSLSLDRIDSSKGYVEGNVRFISNRANTLKRTQRTPSQSCWARTHRLASRTIRATIRASNESSASQATHRAPELLLILKDLGIGIKIADPSNSRTTLSILKLGRGRAAPGAVKPV